ncbi:MAG: glycosyl transferase [Synechococcaceae cyanobacterium RL_1_2]|nr:glycosyl transferase [Synechococcaceae cyanobacterium RL_1_2]
MSSPVVYFSVTSHGFGHAVRCSAIANAVKQLDPNITIILSTVAPHWLLASCLNGDFIQRHRQFDVGVIQADSLQMDKEATYERWQEIHRHRDRLIASEAEYLATNKVKLVFGDIPPLAGAIAKAAGVPCWLMSNFGWDFIYEDWGGKYLELAEQIRGEYSQSDRLFRLPMHEEMASFSTIEDRGLVGNHPAQDLEHLRETFKLHSPKEKTILLSFGGMGVDSLPYQDLQAFPDWQFISFDQKAPEIPNLVKISTHTYRPVDFMPYAIELCQNLAIVPLPRR